MKFQSFSNLEGKHAAFSPSSPSWLRYSDDQALEVYSNKQAASLGSALHAWAKTTIDLGIKQPKSKRTLYAYVNDCIGYRMSTEVVLYYSDYFFGTADAISFVDNQLRIFDLKTGRIPAHIEQIRIYAALFCLQYKMKPQDISIELRMYQEDQVLVDTPSADEISEIMRKIVHLDGLIKKKEEYQY